MMAEFGRTDTEPLELGEDLPNGSDGLAQQCQVRKREELVQRGARGEKCDRSDTTSL